LLAQALHLLCVSLLLLYALLPFTFCIAVTPEELEIFTLKADNTMTSVFYANLTDIVDRWSCVVAAVNIARISELFIGSLPPFDPCLFFILCATEGSVCSYRINNCNNPTSRSDSKIAMLAVSPFGSNSEAL
jgi:hypothetical protein